MSKRARPKRRSLAVRGEGGSVPLDEHARRITASWRKSVEAIVETGLLLLAARADHPRHWCRLFRKGEDRLLLAQSAANAGEEDVPDPVAHPIPVSLGTAERLMRIAEHPVLSNSATWPNLPGAWRVLYELTQIIPVKRLTRLIERGDIGPETTVKQAIALRRLMVQGPDGRVVPAALLRSVWHDRENFPDTDEGIRDAFQWVEDGMPPPSDPPDPLGLGSDGPIEPFGQAAARDAWQQIVRIVQGLHEMGVATTSTAEVLHDFADTLDGVDEKPPPTIPFKAYKGPWQKRKVAWRAWGLDDRLGRGANLLTSEGTVKAMAKYGHRTHGTSVFDPVLAEVVYERFCPPGGAVLDPFAGGPTRGIVAACLGLRYTGVDLSERQIEANRALAEKLHREHPGQLPSVPDWVLGDSRDLDRLLPKDYRADFVFTCPPYWNLEKYSKDDRDLSNAKTYEEFLALYDRALTPALRRLRADRFAAVVTGDLTDRRTGEEISLATDTVGIARAAGVEPYYTGILETPIGTAALRAPHVYRRTGKHTRVHQYVTIFRKEDDDPGRPVPRNRRRLFARKLRALRRAKTPPRPRRADT